MKNLLPILFILTVFISCNDKQRYTQKSSEIETVKTIIKAYNSKDYESVVSHFADTANVFFNSKTPFKATTLPERHNKDDVNFSSRGFLEEGQEYEMVLTDDGNTWVNFWGDWQGTLAEGGDEINIPIHLTLQFINGKVVTEFGYWDNSKIVLALQNKTEVE